MTDDVEDKSTKFHENRAQYQKRKKRQQAKSKSLTPLKRLVPFVLRYPVRLALTLVFLLTAAGAQLAIPASAGKLIDKGFIAQNLDNVGQYGIVIMVLALVSGVAGGARFYFISALGERILTDLRKAVFDHLLSLDAAFFDTHRVGELTSRLNGDVATIRSAIGSTASVAMRSFVTLFGAIFMMFLTSPRLSVGVLIVMPLIVIPLLVYSRRLRKMSRRTQDRLANLSAMATESLGATKTLKAFVQEAAQSAAYGVHAEASFRAQVDRLLARAVLIGLVTFLTTAGLVGLVWFGAISVFQGAVTVGQLGQFVVYAVMASGAMTGMSEIFGTLQTVAGSTERLVEILDTEPNLPEPAQPVALPEPPLGTVAFKHVDFTYRSRERERVLHDVSFSVGRGETVALVGPSGAGKSTAFALLQRFYDVSSGAVEVDGIDVRSVRQTELRRRLAYVEQESVMFAGTIGDNIRFGRPEASEAEVEEAARAALVHDFVTELENGYDSIVGERGVMLSGGQKQRVAIARALLKDAPILLLDEATSALDAQSEHLVQIALGRLMEGRTTLVIAHRLATIRDADRIVVFDKGRVIDEGTHEELVVKDGRYAELARLQFRNEIPSAPELAM